MPAASKARRLGVLLTFGEERVLKRPYSIGVEAFSVTWCVLIEQGSSVRGVLHCDSNVPAETPSSRTLRPVDKKAINAKALGSTETLWVRRPKTMLAPFMCCVLRTMKSLLMPGHPFSSEYWLSGFRKSVAGPPEPGYLWY